MYNINVGESFHLGNDFYMKSNFTGDYTKLVICFHFANNIPTFSDCDSGLFAPFGYQFCKDRNINVISFSPVNKNNWYRSLELINYIKSILPFLNKFEFRFGYGSSMGAFGIATFSKLLSIDFALLFSPISTLNNSLVPFENRFYNARKNLDWNSEYYDATLGLTNGIILVDPFHREDFLHAKRFSSSIRKIFIPGGGHNLPRFLFEVGLLKDLFNSSFEQKILNDIFFKKLKLRRKLDIYYKNLLLSNRLTNSRRILIQKFRAINACDNSEKKGSFLYLNQREIHSLKRIESYIIDNGINFDDFNSFQGIIKRCALLSRH